jgi:FixJ family two-component response regulator
VQVVFVTGQATGDIALEALEKGAAYIEKPFEPTRLFAAVSEAISLSRLKRSAGS